MRTIFDKIKQKIQSRADEFSAPLIYRNWIQKFDLLTDENRRIIKENIENFPRKPLISIVLPVYNVEEKWLRLCLDSVLKQLYENWELCIADDDSLSPHVKKILREYGEKDARIKTIFRAENGHISAASNSALKLATGEFCALLDHDDELSEHALYFVAEEINRFPEADLIYSDEDMIDEKGARYNPNFKPDFSRDLFYSLNLFTHLSVYRTKILRRIGGFRIGAEGSQDYDLALRFTDAISEKNIRHIPRILYHWRAIKGSVALASSEKSYAHERAREALRLHFSRQKIDAEVEKGFYEFHRVKYDFSEDISTSLIICGDSKMFEETPKNCEIISVKDSTASEFNSAVKSANGEVLIFFDGSFEPQNSDWLNALSSLACQPQIGAVGAKILNENETVRNGGIILGVNNLFGFAHRNLPRTSAGNLQRAQVINNFSAVSGVLAIRRELFEKMNGFDTKNFPNGFFDVDFCLRSERENYRIVFTPYAEFVQTSESSTEKFLRKKTAPEIENFRRIWKEKIENDKFYNPNFSLKNAEFQLAFPPRTEKISSMIL